MQLRHPMLATAAAAAVIAGGLVLTVPGTAHATSARCSPTSQPSGYGNWTKTYCHTWHSSYGLRNHSDYLGTGSEWVVCQTPAGVADNPAYGGHHNTRWVWTLGDRGTWDYFPETAFVEGGENAAIGGIPRC